MVYLGAATGNGIHDDKEASNGHCEHFIAVLCLKLG